MSPLSQDLRYAFRGLRRTPGFTLAALLTLALGIGATSAIYSIGNGILWRPLPVPNAEQLAVLYAHRSDDGTYQDLSWPDYREIRGGSAAVFQDVIAYTPRPVSLKLTGQAERAWAELVSANYFSVLGRPPVLGRGFLPSEDSAGAAPAAILSDALWRSRFQADPGVLGRPLQVNGRAFTVVGVAAPDFRTPFYVGFSPALWVPAGSWSWLGNDPQTLEARGQVSFRMLGRLKPGVEVTTAVPVVDGVLRRLAETYPVTNRGLTAAVFAERDARPEPGLAGSMRLGLRLLLVISGVVLLVACANVASLLLARALGRRREVAVRMALGAGRGRLVRQLLAESLVLAAVGGGLGLVLAGGLSGAVESLLSFATDIPFTLDFSLDRRVVLFTMLITLGTTFVFGLVPALQGSAPGVAGALKTDALGWRGMHRSRLRAALVVGQLALSCLLLAAAALVVRSFAATERVSPGFETSNGLLVSVSPGLRSYDAAGTRALLRDLRERLAGLPGVAGVTLAAPVPLEFVSNSAPVVPEGGVTAGPDRPGQTAGWTTVGPDYFRVMGTPLLEGRDFGPGDSLAARPVAVISRHMAERFWPGQPAIGKVFHLNTLDGTAFTVVGVAADAKYRQLTEAPEPHVYIPLSQDGPPEATFVIRGTVSPLSLLPAIRAEIAARDPDLPVSDTKTMEALLAGRALLLPRIAMRVTAALATLALLLAVVGLYGVVAYAVAQRTRELGIRVALGATSGMVSRLMLRDGIKLAVLGIGLGLAGAVAVTRVARGLLFGVSPLDPVALGGTVAVLALVTLLASWIPARRAARVAPIEALRSE